MIYVYSDPGYFRYATYGLRLINSMRRLEKPGTSNYRLYSKTYTLFSETIIRRNYELFLDI